MPDTDLRTFVGSQVKRLVVEKYPHLRFPSVLRARVTAMSKVGDRTWQYNLKPLSPGPTDLAFPEIPNVKSHLEVEAGVGGMVAVALIDGRASRVVIVDEVFL